MEFEEEGVNLGFGGTPCALVIGLLRPCGSGVMSMVMVEGCSASRTTCDLVPICDITMISQSDSRECFMLFDRYARTRWISSELIGSIRQHGSTQGLA